MKRQSLVFIGFLVNLLSVVSAFGQVEKNFTTTINDLNFTRERSIYNRVSIIKRGSFMHEIGKPMMPIRVIQLIIPEHTSVTGVTVVSSNSTTLGDSFYIYPAQPFWKSGGDSIPPFVPPDSTTYNSNLPYPGKIVEFQNERYMKEGHLVTLYFYPLQWIPSLRRLSLYTNARLRVELTPNSNPVLEAKRRSEKLQVEFETYLGKILDNPEDIGSYLRRPALIQGFGEKVEKPIITSLPSMNGLPVEYVVITSRGDSSAWKDLVDWKFSKGVPATIRTIEWIYDHYTGCDHQEQIRNFIKDAYTFWGTEWVLLSKDTDTIPDRLLSFYGPYDHTPSDYYYCTKDGNFNANGNNLFGEYGSPPSGDDPDLGWDLSVGRVPARSINDVLNYTAKVLQYEDLQPSDIQYVQKLLFLGAKPYGECYDIWNIQEPIVHNIAPPSWTKYRLYNPDCVVGEGQLNIPNTITQMNNAYHIIDHCDHCTQYTLGTDCDNGHGVLQRTDFDALQSPWKCSIMYTLGCWPCAIDFDCVGERFLLNPSGGGMAFIGNTHDGYFTQPGTMHFYTSLFSDQIYPLGWAFENARISESGPYFYQLTLLGDPETPVWTDTPANINVTHPTSITMGQQPFQVTVFDRQMPPNPVQGVDVCLLKEDASGVIEAYASGVTDGSGQITFTYTPETQGNISVTVVGHNPSPPYVNYLPYIGTCTVTGPAAQPYIFPALNGRTFGDYPPNGNGDGKPNPGETISLFVALTNSGNQDATNVTAQISTTDPFVTISQGFASYGLIPHNQTVTNVFPYTLSIANFCPDVHDAQFGITITDGNNNQWQDKFLITILCDTLMLVSHGHLDMTPGSKTLDSLKIFNNGAGLSSVVSAQLSFVGLGVVIGNNTINYPNIPAGATRMSGGFTYTVGLSPSGHFELTMRDQFNRTWMKRIAFSTSDDSVHTPSRPSCIPGQKAVDLTWTRDSRDSYDFVAGYHVYRSESYAGPFTLMDSLIRATSEYRDTFGVQPDHRYFYKISSVDTSLNESPLSDTGSVLTNAPLANGWPQRIGGNGVVWSSPVIGDIWGDSHKELVVAGGDSKVHAWTSDGSSFGNWPVQVNDPAGIGTRGEQTPALADVNGDGKKEVIFGNGTRVYLWSGDGTEIHHWDIFPDTVISSPTVEDINGDGQPDIIIGGQGTLYAWDWRGSEIWSKFNLQNNEQIRASVSVGDLDNDGKKEVVASTWGCHIYAWYWDGSTTPHQKWVYTPPPGLAGFGSPALGDIDQDGYLEVIVAFNHDAHNQMDDLFYLDHSGNCLHHPRMYPTGSWCSPAIGNVQGDSKLEILTASAGYVDVGPFFLQCFDYQGNNPWLYSTQTSFCHSSPIIGGSLIEGGGKDVALAWDGLTIPGPSLLGINGADGIPLVEGWPLSLNGASWSSPSIGDIDANGKTGIVTATEDGFVYLWKTQIPFLPVHTDWGMIHHDTRNTGLYSQPVYGPLPSSTTWQGNIVITNNVTVPLLGSLTILPGTVIKFRIGPGGVPNKLIVNGSLHAVGTTADSIYFTSEAENPAGNDWYGIDVMSGGIANLQYCALDYGYNNIIGESGSNVTISNSRISNAAAAGIVLRNGTHNVSNNIISNNALFGINIWGPWGGNATVQNNTITNNTTIPTYGVYAHYNINSGSLHIYSNTIQYASMPPNPTLYGIECDTVTNVATLYGNSITGYGQGGIRIYRSSPKCTCNVVTNCITYGLYFNNGPSIVTHNTVNGVSNGAYVYSSNATNTPNLGNVGNLVHYDDGLNSIEGILYDGWNSSSPQVKAENNYWGSTRTFYGSWDYNPYLSLPPLPCGGFGGPQMGELLEQQLPRIFALAQSYPNPSTGSMAIHYQMPKESEIALKVYNISGQLVKTFVNETQKAGYYQVTWDGRDELGHSVRSGVYFYRMEAGDFRAVRKLVIVR